VAVELGDPVSEVYKERLLQDAMVETWQIGREGLQADSQTEVGGLCGNKIDREKK
jgi:hypothetical protein